MKVFQNDASSYAMVTGDGGLDGPHLCRIDGGGVQHQHTHEAGSLAAKPSHAERMCIG